MDKRADGEGKRALGRGDARDQRRGRAERGCPVALSNADQHRSGGVQDGDRHVQVSLR